MFDLCFRLGWLCTRTGTLLAALWSFLGAIAPSGMAAESPVSTVAAPPFLESQPHTDPLEMTQPSVPTDPLDSPHPIPWNWMMGVHGEVSSTEGTGMRYYRSSSLISPDGNFAAYSRIRMEIEPQLFRSRVNSVLFVENLQTGELRTIAASSPLADNPLSDSDEADMPGNIAVLMPVTWSQSGDRVLAREFEGRFSTSDASDYAVVWDRQRDRTHTLAPNRVHYTNAILLGWSQTYPDRVLFRAGIIGERDWPLWAVDLGGSTVAVREDRPLVFGRSVNNVWTGPQAHW
jgi:hypothetical protein